MDESETAVNVVAFGFVFLGLVAVAFAIGGLRDLWKREHIGPGEAVEFLGMFIWLGFGISAGALGLFLLDGNRLQ